MAEHFFVRGGIEIMVGIRRVPARIQALQARYYRRFNYKVVAFFQACAVGSTVVLLTYHQIVDEIQVYVVGCAEFNLFDKHRRIALNHVESAGETHCGGIARYECELYASYRINHHRVGEIELVKIRRDFRQRRHKTVLKQRDVVLIYVYLPQYVFIQSPEVFRIGNVVDSGSADSLYGLFLRARIFPIVHLRCLFARYDVEDRLAGEFRRLHMLNHPGKLFKPMLKLLSAKVIRSYFR